LLVELGDLCGLKLKDGWNVGEFSTANRWFGAWKLAMTFIVGTTIEIIGSCHWSFTKDSSTGHIRTTFGWNSSFGKE
jgi:hypothetical protein